MILRSTVLMLMGLGTLLLSIFLPDDMIKHDGSLLIYSIIFFTGSIITSAVENHKCHT